MYDCDWVTPEVLGRGLVHWGAFYSGEIVSQKSSGGGSGTVKGEVCTRIRKRS